MSYPMGFAEMPFPTFGPPPPSVALTPQSQYIIVQQQQPQHLVFLPQAQLYPQAGVAAPVHQPMYSVGGYPPQQTAVVVAAPQQPNVVVLTPYGSPSTSRTVSPSASLTGITNTQPSMTPPVRPPPRYGEETLSSSPTPNASLTSPGMTPNSSMNNRPPVSSTVWGYAVVDPLHPRLQRVPIASSVVALTQAITQYDTDVVASSAKPCLSAVCLKYNSELPDGGCPSGTHCTNFHVASHYLERARKVWDPICCAQHNCYFTNEMIRANLVPHLTNCRFVLIMDRTEVEISITQLAFTVGLEQLPLRAGRTRVITGKNLCRLHFDSKCKWTKDCGHIHVCRELFKYLQAFHYPSLHFLLMTEENPDALVGKMQQKMLLEFIRSDCSRPLIKSLMDNGKTAALTALRRCGASIPGESTNQTTQETVLPTGNSSPSN